MKRTINPESIASLETMYLVLVIPILVFVVYCFARQAIGSREMYIATLVISIPFVFSQLVQSSGKFPFVVMVEIGLVVATVLAVAPTLQL